MSIRPFHPSDPQRGGQTEAGFTLLELLIAMTLFLLIIVILGGSLRLGFRSIDAAEKKMDVLERFRTSFGIITAQLQSSVPLTHEEEGTKKYYLKGDATNLQFATNYSIWGGEKGCVIVTYRLEAADKGKLSLYASERSVGMEEMQEVKLFDDLKALSFSYFGREVTEEDGKWTEEWSDDTRYPEQLKVNLSRDRGEAKILVPLYARIKNRP
jgi:prepilin-type N-terminal cleavage/methylation domain-containing protein